MAAEVANLQEAALSIEELEEEIRREHDRRYAFYRMLHATDRLLWRLEELNVAGVRTVPAEALQAMRRALCELPSSCAEALALSDRVQEVLDSVFEVQERLFRWRDPGRQTDGEEFANAAPDADQAEREKRFRRRVALLVREAGQAGVSLARLTDGAATSEERQERRRILDAMEAEGLHRSAVRQGNGGGRRYFAVGERTDGE